MSGASQRGRRIDRVDEDEAVAGIDCERADLVLPLVVPRCPTPQAGRELIHRATMSFRRGGSLDRGFPRRELVLAQADVRVPPETAREDARRLDRRGVGDAREDGQRPGGTPPGPAVAARVVLGVADDRDDCEDGLPAGRVTDGEVAPLQRRTPSGRMRPQGARVDALREETVARPTNEKPVLHPARRFLTGREYARRIRASAISTLAVTLLVAFAGCGDLG